MINIEGQVIGITQSKITTTEDGSTSVEGLGFAIPSNDVVNIINKLETDGKISETYVESNSMGNKNVANCITGRIRSWRFPKPKGGSVTVAYPFIFSPST